MIAVFTIIGLTSVFAFINFTRGRGRLKKYGSFAKVLCAIAWGWIAGLAAAMLGHQEPIVSHVIFVTALGMWVWVVPGWGLYFSAFTGQWKEEESEIGFIDEIGFDLVPYISETDVPSNRFRGMICMALRGFIFSLPLFIGLAWAVNWWALFLWPSMLVQGVFYYANRPLAQYGNIMPETATGAWLGFIIGIILA